MKRTTLGFLFFFEGRKKRDCAGDFATRIQDDYGFGLRPKLEDGPNN